MSTATLPDVCLTPAPPAPPVPTPYPNIAVNSDLVKGTTTVFADGGNMIAIQGSQLSQSSGDEPGVAGGVTSGVNMMETDWMTYSMDVFMDGANVCRLSDKQFHNHYNTVNMNGQLEAPLPDPLTDELKWLCEIMCDCLVRPNIMGGRRMMQGCVDEWLQINQDYKTQPGQKSYPKILPETGYNAPAGPDLPPTPRDPGTGKGYRAPDSIIVNDPSQPPAQNNIEYLVEMKFKYPGYCDTYKKQQQDRDLEIAGDPKKIVVLTPEKCGCPPAPDPFDPTKPNVDNCETDDVHTPEMASELGAESFTALALLVGAALEAAAAWLGIGAGGAIEGGVDLMDTPELLDESPANDDAVPPYGMTGQNDSKSQTGPAGVPNLAPPPSAVA